MVWDWGSHNGVSAKGTNDHGGNSIARDSGAKSGKRPARGGRAGVRSLLYVVVMAVRRCNAEFERGAGPALASPPPAYGVVGNLQ